MNEQAGASSHDIADALRRWATDTALPFWATAGFDRARGGFHEQLAADGTPSLTAPKRLRVQARQIYVYSHAAVLGWYDGLDLAFDALAFMLARYRAPDGAPGFVHLIAPDGTVANPLRDTYDHAFVLLALAWLFHASGDAQVRALIDEVLAFIDAHLTAPDGSYFEGIPRSLPRRQNPHMHAFEAMLALHERAGHPDAMARAGRLLALFETRFIDAKTGTLREYFTDAWTPAPGAEGDIVEPGHHAEWTWLLRQYERLNGLPHGTRASTLIDTAVRWSDPPTGFLIDEADRHGGTLEPRAAPGRRPSLPRPGSPRPAALEPPITRAARSPPSCGTTSTSLFAAASSINSMPRGAWSMTS